MNFNKIINAGGDFIANKMFLQPGLDKMKGEHADKRRQLIKALREVRNRERYRWDKEGKLLK